MKLPWLCSPGSGASSGPVGVPQVSQPDPAAYLGARFGERYRCGRQRRSWPTWLADACLRWSRRAPAAQPVSYPLHRGGQGSTHIHHCPPGSSGSHVGRRGFALSGQVPDWLRDVDCLGLCAVGGQVQLLAMLSAVADRSRTRWPGVSAYLWRPSGECRHRDDHRQPRR
jgi:hypothetical protein